LDSIKISFNAGSRSTYKTIHGVDHWARVAENIRKIAEYREKGNRNIALYLSTILTDLTRPEKEGIEEEFGSLVDEILFVDCDAQQGQMPANEGELYGSTVVPEKCSLPFNRIHVTCEGYLTVCCVDYQNYLAVADLNDESLSEAWENEAFQAIRRRHLENDLAGTLCGNCLGNRRDAIEPLCPELAAVINFPRLYEESRMDIRARLGKWSD
jgi:hypothetical protein